MATTVPNKPLYETLNSDQDLSGKTFRFVLASGALCGANGFGIGITTDDVEDFSATGAERQIQIQKGGDMVITSGASFSKGDLLASDSDGRGVTATSGQNGLVRAKRAATAANEHIPCTWEPRTAP